MFRRRRPRRRPVPPPVRRAWLARPLPPRVLQRLRRAEAHMQAGRYAEAAALWLDLAQAARRRGWTARAAGLTLRAAQALALAGRVEDAQALAGPALDTLVQHGRLGWARGLAQRLEDALRQAGAAAQAEAWHTTWVARLSARPPTAGPAAQPAVLTLPTHCPACGAPVRHDEVEWAPDRQAAYCAYCGVRVAPAGG